ncbi:MAG TPA: hypothetical protein VF059_05880 [Casimicrobiaceae bacterium]
MDDDGARLRGGLLWVLPFAIVAVALGYETDWGRGMTREAPAAAAPSPQPVAVSLLPEYRVDGGVEARKETVERVLFNPTRRPAPPATQTAESGSMKKGLYTLTGTTVVGDVATAFLREVKGGKARSVRRGDKLDDVLVAEVLPDHVRLRQGNDFEELPLRIATGPKATIQSVAPVAVAPAQPGAQPVAAAPAAVGGSATPVAAQQPVRPGATTPGATPRPGTVSVSELLAERRRAARAAAEAARAGQAPTQQHVQPQ